jgi:hypothetical protein
VEMVVERIREEVEDAGEEVDISNGHVEIG